MATNWICIKEICLQSKTEAKTKCIESYHRLLAFSLKGEVMLCLIFLVQPVNSNTMLTCKWIHFEYLHLYWHTISKTYKIRTRIVVIWKFIIIIFYLSHIRCGRHSKWIHHWGFQKLSSAVCFEWLVFWCIKIFEDQGFWIQLMLSWYYS